ncbi:C45 family autoproteolytic acyltransferase/hydolase [Georgenia deserti]|uniref:C45 family autoproteolytic acyltransferase/hydrolase n=1 Tax=Georgenia deserti TaxID=2093781 RepID=A0ABW4L0M1_9MICO
MSGVLVTRQRYPEPLTSRPARVPGAVGDSGPAQAGTVAQVGVHTWTSDAASPSVRGTEYGRTFASALANAVRQYLALFASYGMTGAQARYHAETSASAVAAHAPELVEEVGTLARAAGLEEWQVWALNARTEILAAARSAASECSTAVHLPPDGGAPRTFQTWDWVPGVGDDLVAARYPTAAGIGVVTVAEAGQVAKFGVSTHGVGVHLNILNHATDGGGGGVPVHVLARMLLERAETLEEAIAIARSVSVTASTVLTVVTAEPAAACLEISPAGVGVVRARSGTTLVHANHFLDPELAAGEAVPTDSTTWARMDCLTAHADLIALSPPVERARALGSLPRAPISVRPTPALPAYRRSETKLTLALDVAGTAVEYHPGAPADVTVEGWRRAGIWAPTATPRRHRPGHEDGSRTARPAAARISPTSSVVTDSATSRSGQEHTTRSGPAVGSGASQKVTSAQVSVAWDRRGERVCAWSPSCRSPAVRTVPSARWSASRRAPGTGW